MTNQDYRVVLLRILGGFASSVGTLVYAANALATTYYVDASAGKDVNDGKTPQSAWQSISKVEQAVLLPGDNVLFKRGGMWRGQLRPLSGNADTPITYGAYGSGPKPIIQGSMDKSSPADWAQDGSDLWSTSVPGDVGNIIFDHGTSVGVKKWSEAELAKPGDFYSTYSAGKLYLYSEGNPGSAHSSIELALKGHVVSYGNTHHVVIENLHARYAGTHGFGGGGPGKVTHHVTIRNCDISYIGGAAQSANKTLRLGNGIEFYQGAHDNLVERNRLWEIYDAALTNQGPNQTSATNSQYNIRYRHNLVWHAEYCFEMQNNPATSDTNNIYFENNTCIGSGRGWGHAQRPNPNGRHIMSYDNRSKTTNVFIRNNVFYDATDSPVRIGHKGASNWLGALTMDNNCWFQPQGGLFASWMGKDYSLDRFATYRSETGQDAHSLLLDPQLSDDSPPNGRLLPQSPCISLGADIGLMSDRQ